MKKAIIIATPILVLFGCFIYYISHTVIEMTAAGKKDSIVTSYDAPGSYAGLFEKNSKFSFVETTTSKTRNPITKFEYDSKFEVDVYRISTAGEVSLTEIDETHKNDHISYYHTYNGLSEFHTYSVSYKSGGQDVARSIYLNLFGEGTFTIKKNDSLAYYYSRAKNFYVKFRKDGIQDFFVGSTDDWREPVIPMEVMLTRRAGQLYLVLLVAEKESYHLAPGTLLTLMKK